MIQRDVTFYETVSDERGSTGPFRVGAHPEKLLHERIVFHLERNQVAYSVVGAISITGRHCFSVSALSA